MAWPSTSAGTTHLDAGTDNPGLARADIKQAVDNVNAIKDEFGDVSITSVANGEVLQYNSSNSRWENAPGANGQFTAFLELSAGRTNSSSTSPEPHRPLVQFDELIDPGGIVSTSTTADYSDELGPETETGIQCIGLAAGTYIIAANGLTYGEVPVQSIKLNDLNEENDFRSSPNGGSDNVVTDFSVATLSSRDYIITDSGNVETINFKQFNTAVTFTLSSAGKIAFLEKAPAVGSGLGYLRLEIRKIA